jgi:hypothetical protein
VLEVHDGVNLGLDPNSRCKANFWNRDVNATRNMLELLRIGLKGELGSSRLRASRQDSH